MEPKSGFHATSLGHSSESSKTDEGPSNSDSTFMQHQVALQRTPSTVKEHISALSSRLSIKSNDSHDSNKPNVIGTLSSIPQLEVEDERGRARADSDASIVEATNKCSLSKSNSERSTKSTKSVRSIAAVRHYPLGSLRVHSPSPTRLPNGEQHECLKSGDALVIRDVPKGSLIGFDTMCFIIPDRFDGVKDIPPGAHFIWGGPNSTSFRNGFWIMSSKRASEEFGEIVLKRWDKYNELLEEEASTAEIRIQKSSLLEFINTLWPYNQFVGSSSTEILAKYPDIWRNLTSSMKGAFLTKLTSQEWNHWQVSSTHDRKTTNSVSNDNKDEVLSFVVPKDSRTFSQTSTGRDRTEQAMDTSSHIMGIIASCAFEDSDEIIGELQFCFITGMFLGNLACMEQWGYIIKVVFRAFRLAAELPEFFSKFIRAFHTQLIYNMDGLDSSIFEHDPYLENDLKMILIVFKSHLTEQLLAQGSDLSAQQSDVGMAFEELEAWLWKLDWDLRGNYVRSGKFQLEDGENIDAELRDFEAEDERGEFAAQVVDLDDEGREKGLISF